MNRQAASGESAGCGRALGADQSSSTVSRRNCRKASRLKCANNSAEKTGSTSHAGGRRLLTERQPPIRARTSVASGKRWGVRGELVGRGLIKKKHKLKQRTLKIA